MTRYGHREKIPPVPRKPAQIHVGSVENVHIAATVLFHQEVRFDWWPTAPALLALQHHGNFHNPFPSDVDAVSSSVVERCSYVPSEEFRPPQATT